MLFIPLVRGRGAGRSCFSEQLCSERGAGRNLHFPICEVGMGPHRESLGGPERGDRWTAGAVSPGLQRGLGEARGQSHGGGPAFLRMGCCGSEPLQGLCVTSGAAQATGFCGS